MQLSGVCINVRRDVGNLLESLLAESPVYLLAMQFTQIAHQMATSTN